MLLLQGRLALNQESTYYVIIACIILKENRTENKHWLSLTP